MDIHKPKPWHGLREFLKEYAIIVVGVLTALGAEQTVEYLHVQAQVRDAREALRDEISRDATYAAETADENRCIDAWLDKLAAYAEGGPRPDTMGASTANDIFPTTVWDVVKTGALTHMPLKEQLAYAQFYFFLQNANGIAQHERDDAQQIVAYTDQESLTPDQARGFLLAIAHTRPLVHVQEHNNPLNVERARALGAGPKPLAADRFQRLSAFCAAAGGPAPTVEH